MLMLSHIPPGDQTSLPDDNPIDPQGGFDIVLAIITGTLLCVLFWWMYFHKPRPGDWRREPQKTSRASIIHEPIDGCPTGTSRVRDMFSRNGGVSWEAGCYDPRGDGSIDVLWPGETVQVGVPYPKVTK